MPASSSGPDHLFPTSSQVRQIGDFGRLRGEGSRVEWLVKILSPLLCVTRRAADGVPRDTPPRRGQIVTQKPDDGVVVAAESAGASDIRTVYNASLRLSGISSSALASFQGEKPPPGSRNVALASASSPLFLAPLPPHPETLRRPLLTRTHTHMYTHTHTGPCRNFRRRLPGHFYRD